MRKPLLLLLLILIFVVTPTTSSVGYAATASTRITFEEQGQYRIISGRVMSAYRTKDGHQIVKLLANTTFQKIRVPIFNSLHYDQQIEFGDNIQVSGRIFDYYGELEVIPDYRENVKVLSRLPKDRILLSVIIGVILYIFLRTLGKKESTGPNSR